MFHRHFTHSYLILFIVCVSSNYAFTHQNLNQSTDEKFAVVTASSLNLRAEPTTSATIVTKAKKGDRVAVLGESGEWLQVKTRDGKVGWSLKKYFAPEEKKISESPRAEENPKPVTESKPIIKKQNEEIVSPQYTYHDVSSLSFGVVGGVALSQLAGSSVTNDFSSRFGFAAGGVLHYKLSDIFGVQPSLLYVMKGATKKVGGIQSTFQLDYIELPVLLRVSFPVSTTVVPYITAGGAVSYNLQAIVTSDAPGVSVQEISDIRKIDYGISAGGGVQMYIANQKFILDARYTFGLSNIHNAETDPLDLKHRTITVVLGWLY